MTDYFVDSTVGDDTDDGTTMDAGGGGGNPGAWATLDFAVGEGGLAAGDTVWVRRIHAEGEPPSSMVFAYNGTPDALIQVIGWPRAADASITSATWTNGATTVDLIVGLSMDAEQHLGRFITAPDGETYMITLITDANTITIDTEYAGPTVTTTDGACTIQEDEDYDTAQAINVAYATEKVAWTADADDMTVVTFLGTAFYPQISSDQCWRFANLWWIGGSSYCFYMSTNWLTIFEGCILQANGNQKATYSYRATSFWLRTILIGSGAGSSSNQSNAFQEGAMGIFRDVAIYGMGDNGINLTLGGKAILDNVNIGVEALNGDAAIAMNYGQGGVKGINVKIGDTDDVDWAYHPVIDSAIEIENYGKVLGAHKVWNNHGSITRVDVVAGSGDPYKRSAGADSVVELLYDFNQAGTTMKNALPDLLEPVFIHEFEATTDSRRYRYYVQSEKGVLASELWIEVEYVSAYDDATEYVIRKVTSDEGIAIRGGVTDWSQYIEVEDIEPAVGSTVRIKCYCSFYDATDKIYIDPLCEVTI